MIARRDKAWLCQYWEDEKKHALLSWGLTFDEHNAITTFTHVDLWKGHISLFPYNPPQYAHRVYSNNSPLSIGLFTLTNRGSDITTIEVSPLTRNPLSYFLLMLSSAYSLKSRFCGWEARRYSADYKGSRQTSHVNEQKQHNLLTAERYGTPYKHELRALWFS